MDAFRLKDYSATPVKDDIRRLLGGMLTADWQQALVARGFGWHMDVGAFSTPLTGGGAGTIIDQDQPEFIINVPQGFACIPLRFHVAAKPALLAADSEETEILIAVDQLAKYDGTGTIGLEVPTNMRTDIRTACPLGAHSAGTVDMTNPTLGIELAHAVKQGDFQGTPANALWTDLVVVYEPLRPPFLVGPCAIYGYWGGTVAATGFANLDFLAIPSSLITGLV